MREGAKTFEDLRVWNKSHQFVRSGYSDTTEFPADERFGLVMQFRKAAVSIPANIAEGFKKRGKADKLRFLNIAQGSLEECRYYLILSRGLKYKSSQATLEYLEETSRLLKHTARQSGEMVDYHFLYSVFCLLNSVF